MLKSQALEVFKNNLIYFVTNEEISNGYNDVEMVEEVLKAGVKVVQLRDKCSSRDVLLRKAKQIRKLTQDYQALLIINDDVDLAIMVEADGVHLGQNDLPIKKARELVKKNNLDFIIGLSTHNLEEISLIEKNIIAKKAVPDYINIGPVFLTQTKVNNYPPLLDKINPDYTYLKKIIQATSLPFTMMGGIKFANLFDLLKIGATHFAMISEITLQKNPQKYLKKNILKIKNGII